MKDTSIVKFNGQIEMSKTSSANGLHMETSKEEFISEVQDMVQHYRLQSFFYLSGSGNMMKNLPEEPHSFALDGVLSEHKLRDKEEPAKNLDPQLDEFPSSVINGFKCYDEFEINDFNLSRLVIESLISADLRQKVKTRFNHFKDFSYLPGQVYFMMILEVCNASFTYDIDSACTSLTTIKLVEAHKGIFLGFSPHHSSDIPLVLNLTTGHISPQYHVVFDDGFDTVLLHSTADDPPTVWQDIGLDDTLYETHVHRILLDLEALIQLGPEWLTPDKREERSR